MELVRRKGSEGRRRISFFGCGGEEIFLTPVRVGGFGIGLVMAIRCCAAGRNNFMHLKLEVTCPYKLNAGLKSFLQQYAYCLAGITSWLSEVPSQTPRVIHPMPIISSDPGIHTQHPQSHGSGYGS